jgi:hypothetical protein
VIKEAYKNVALPLADYRDPVNKSNPNFNVMKLKWREAEVWGAKISKKSYKFSNLPSKYKDYIARNFFTSYDLATQFTYKLAFGMYPYQLY